MNQTRAAEMDGVMLDIVKSEGRAERSTRKYIICKEN